MRGLSDFGKNARAVPEALDLYAAPDRTELRPLDAVLTPPASVLVLVAVAAVAAGVSGGRHRLAWWWAVVAFAALGVVHMLLAWHGDGMETTRHVAVGDVQTRLAVLVLVVAALDAAAGRRVGPRRWTAALARR